jgi:hypothetical protein
MDASTPPFLTHGEWVMAILTATYVGITGFYAWVSRRTLKTIQDQAETNRAQFEEQLKVARNAVAAAQQNAQAIINAERAWVHVRLEHQATNYYAFQVSNVGKTPAIVASFGYRCGAVPVDSGALPENFSEAARKNINLMLTPSQSPRMLENFEMSSHLSKWWADIHAQTKIGIFEAWVKYSDIIGGQSEHETRAVYSYHPRVSSNLLDLPQYNSYT